ncbi:membrane-associated protein [Aliidiomarina maris]|nr:membrane-associated protein [Aliidiomarina maris]
MHAPIPMWLKLSFSAMALAVLVCYWPYYGPQNFLWFSDVALFLLVPALWFKLRLIASSMAIAVLLPELFWTFDFLTLSYLTPIASYMFNSEIALHIRFLSALFHLALPPVLIYLLYRLGYDRRAIVVQPLISAVILILTYLFTDPARNINWAFGPGFVQSFTHPWLYLFGLWLALLIVVYLPTHWLLTRYFRTCQSKPSTV